MFEGGGYPYRSLPWRKACPQKKSPKSSWGAKIEVCVENEI